jgi:hypothetical protein
MIATSATSQNWENNNNNNNNEKSKLFLKPCYNLAMLYKGMSKSGELSFFSKKSFVRVAILSFCCQMMKFCPK